MAVLIGSARIDENGNISGGKPGDQRQTGTPDYMGEVSMQEWYLHDQGWVVLRAKDPARRIRIAQDMRYACNNKHIGYNQPYNYTLYQVAKPVGFDCSMVYTDCTTDCARLVRVCVLYAGIQCDDFYTGNEVSVLMATGQFEKLTALKYTTSSDYLEMGDILVTKTKGHTVVVLSNGSKVGSKEEASKGDTNKTVADFQKWLNRYYPDLVRKGTLSDSLLAVDGDFGKMTRAASITVWKYMADKYYNASLTIGNTNFFEACRGVAKKIDLAEIAKHSTLVVLLQGGLAGKGYYSGAIDGDKISKELLSALKAYNEACGVASPDKLTAATWYNLYN